MPSGSHYDPAHPVGRVELIWDVSERGIGEKGRGGGQGGDKGGKHGKRRWWVVGTEEGGRVGENLLTSGPPRPPGRQLLLSEPGGSAGNPVTPARLTAYLSGRADWPALSQAIASRAQQPLIRPRL